MIQVLQTHLGPLHDLARLWHKLIRCGMPQQGLITDVMALYSGCSTASNTAQDAGTLNRMTF